ncbi:hypothetical protein RJ639_032812 [Escallonia herrerae]|uniref:Methyltransferase n=1 Tax=Escallonia herrerae TaxID=1293975 RepID=A0AA89BF09_9ASTE|nr:hypothetical protein RJ639_032812 [Escallonia herrerae]
MDSIELEIRDSRDSQVQLALLLPLFYQYQLDRKHTAPCLDQSSPTSSSHRKSHGLNLLEIDRVLRAGVYWVLSGPPIGWRVSYKGWERSAQDLESEQNNLEDLARRLCEAFSTYPRTYDLIHAHGLFSMYKTKCDILDILLEMHRIVRPEGAIIIRDRPCRYHWESKRPYRTVEMEQ